MLIQACTNLGLIAISCCPTFKSRWQYSQAHSSLKLILFSPIANCQDKYCLAMALYIVCHLYQRHRYKYMHLHGIYCGHNITKNYVQKVGFLCLITF